MEDLIVKNFQKKEASLEVKKATWSNVIKIFKFYDKILASGENINAEHIAKCHAYFKELLFNVKPEILCDNMPYSLTRYMHLYSKLLFKILEQDKNINFLALNSYSQKPYLEKVNKKINKEKSQLIRLCGDEILAEYCDNALKTCLKYEMSHVDIVRILNQYVNTKEKIVGRKEEQNFQEQGFLSILRLIINSDVSFEEFCELYQLNEDTAKKIIKKGKVLDYSLYEQVKHKLEEKRAQRDQTYGAIAEEALNYCQNGINYDKQIIKFTILDYYCLTLEKPGMLWHKAAAGKYKKNNWDYPFLNEDYESPTVVLDVFKSNKRVIDGVVINQNMIDEVYEFLMQSEIPVTFKSLDIALTRYVRGIPILPLKNKNLTLVLNKA